MSTEGPDAVGHALIQAYRNTLSDLTQAQFDAGRHAQLLASANKWIAACHRALSELRAHAAGIGVDLEWTPPVEVHETAAPPTRRDVLDEGGA